jgi:hypothetical protein
MEAFSLFVELVCNRDMYEKIPEAANVLANHDSFMKDYIYSDKASQPKKKKR